MTTAIELLIENTNLSTELKAIANKVINNERITVADGITLYEQAELGFVGVLANYVRERKNGNATYFNRNFHIEPTNICVYDCKFCSYSRKLKQKDGQWELSVNDMLHLVKKYDGKPITEVHIVGGVHPRMDVQFFGEALAAIKAHRPSLHIKGFTAVELYYMFRKGKMEMKEGLQFLQSKGLDSLPGGGAEIFDETIRTTIAEDKCTSVEWLAIHEAAHELGMASNCTMLYGHIETYAHRVDHMNRLRDLQDKTKGFNTFIPLKFRNHDNQMSHVPESTVIEDLRNYAIARIFLDNINHIKAYWPMIGRETAALSMNYGVDDIDGTIDDSTKIYSMAGAEEQAPSLTTQQLVDLIKHAGRTPIERDTLYNIVKDYSVEEVVEG